MHIVVLSRTSMFSLTPPPHFNVVVATKSIGQSNILNIERGRGELIGCNAISLKMREKAQIIANFLCVSTMLHGIVDVLRNVL